MNLERKNKELEYRIFNLEKSLDIVLKKLNQIEEALPFYYDESQENENLNSENLLSLKNACTLLNINESKLMEWVQKDVVSSKRVGEITYFDKSELKAVFRKMMTQNLE